jgi:hypothetical protein
MLYFKSINTVALVKAINIHKSSRIMQKGVVYSSNFVLNVKIWIKLYV